MSDKPQALKVADGALEEALEALNRAYAAEADCEPGILVDYIVLYATRRYDEDGDPLTAYGMQWPSDSRTSHYAALGLLDYAREKIKRALFDTEDDE